MVEYIYLKKMLEVCTKIQRRIYPLMLLEYENIIIKPSKIGEVIGPGGKQIRAIY